MPTKITTRLYRRRYDFKNRNGSRTNEWVECKTLADRDLTAQQQQEFEALCSRFGRPRPGNDSAVGTFTQT